ncbi:CAP domain-containing protein, partial [Mycobacterium kansasii]
VTRMDPNPDYDASDEVEYGFQAFAWILRGAYPPPAYPEQ